MCKSVEVFGIYVYIYDWLNVIGGVALILSNLMLYYRKCDDLSVFSKAIVRKKKKRGLMSDVRFYAFVEMFILSLAELLICIIACRCWGKLLSDSYSNFFGIIYFFPFVFYFVCCLFCDDPLHQLDIMTPSIAIMLFFFKWGCFFNGCCFGYELTSSFYYNIFTERYELPLQLFEAFSAAIIWACLTLYNRSEKKKTGRTFPLFILFYCSIRFILEFFDEEYSIGIGRITSYHPQCLAGIVLGITELWFISHHAEKIPVLEISLSKKGKRSHPKTHNKKK